jgi:predicted XRE-type DNA-binding protein
VYVIHAFEKKVRQTRQADVQLAQAPARSRPVALAPRGRVGVATRIHRSSGNVFRDLGFAAAEAENLRLRSELMIRLRELIERRKLTQAAAALLFGVTQPRVSDLVRGRIDLFSIDALVKMLARGGVRVGLVVKPSRASPGPFRGFNHHVQETHQRSKVVRTTPSGPGSSRF